MAIELNISCPNIKKVTKSPSHQVTGLISQDAKATFEVVKAARKVTQKTLITKLSPNVTDITEIAQAAEAAGTDAVALINTLMGMSIEVKAGRPKIAMGNSRPKRPGYPAGGGQDGLGGLQKSENSHNRNGGIMDTHSALEFFIAGSSAIAVGTANFINPRTTIEIISGLEKYLARNKIKDIKELIGSLKI